MQIEHPYFEFRYSKESNGFQLIEKKNEFSMLGDFLPEISLVREKVSLRKYIPKESNHAFKDALGYGRRYLFNWNSINGVADVEAKFFCYGNKPFLCYQISLTNCSNSVIQLEAVDFVISDSLRCCDLGEGIEKAKIFAESGDCHWSGVKEIVSTSYEGLLGIHPDQQNLLLQVGRDIHCSFGIGLVYNPVSGVTLNMSFLTFDRAGGYIHIGYDERKNAINKFRVFNLYGGYLIKPGERFKSEMLFIDVRRDAQESLECYADCVKLINNIGDLDRIMVGWSGYAGRWDENKEKTYELYIQENLKVIKEKLSGLGLDYVWVTMGNFWRDLPNEIHKENTERFPSGFQETVRRIQESGMKLGLWTTPYWTTTESKLFQDHPEYILKDKKGQPFNIDKDEKGNTVYWKYRFGRWFFEPQEKCPTIYFLDPSHPGVLKWLREFYRELVARGARYFMLDFINGPQRVEADIYDKNMVPGVEAYRAGLSSIRETVGKEVFLSSSSGPSIINLKILDSSRVGYDYVERYELASDWVLHRTCGTSMAAKYFTHGKFFINESVNMLTVGEPIPIDTAKFITTLFGMSGSTVWLGDDITSLSEERLCLIKNILPKYKRIARPVNLFKAGHPQGYPDILDQKVYTDWGEWHVVALLNYDDKQREMKFSFQDIGFDAGQKVRIFDFWNREYLGEFSTDYKKVLKPHIAQVLSVRRSMAHPWVIGTDMHITQGWELSSVKWDPQRAHISGIAARPIGTKGRIFIYVPEKFSVKGVEGDNISYMIKSREVVVIVIHFVTEEVQWKVYLHVESLI